MDPQSLAEAAKRLADQALRLGEDAAALAHQAGQMTQAAANSEPFIALLTVFILACFVGYYVVWSVTPALHSPLMGVTNAISSVIIVGARIAAGPAGVGFAKTLGFVAVTLASVNIFGGFIVTQRMLQMFKRKPKASEAPHA